MSMKRILEWERQIGHYENEIGFAEFERKEAEENVKNLTRDIGNYEDIVHDLQQKINVEPMD